MKKSNLRIICPFCHKTIYTYYYMIHPNPIGCSLNEESAFKKKADLMWEKHLRHMDICKEYKKATLNDCAKIIQQEF